MNAYPTSVGKADGRETQTASAKHKVGSFICKSGDRSRWESTIKAEAGSTV